MLTSKMKFPIYLPTRTTIDTRNELALIGGKFNRAWRSLGHSFLKLQGKPSFPPG